MTCSDTAKRIVNRVTNLKTMSKLLALAIVIIALSCHKNQPASPIVTITGSVIDTVRNRPVEGVTVMAYETDCFGLCVNARVTFFDSATTDINGRYELKFNFGGNVSNYHIAVSQDTYRYYGQLNTYMPLLHDTVINFETIGKSILKHNIRSGTFRFQKLYVTSFSTAYMLNQYTADTTLYFDIAPNQKNYLVYQNYYGAQNFAEYWDTILFSGVRDTFERSINLDTVVFR